MSLLNLSQPAFMPRPLVQHRYFETGLYEGDSMDVATRRSRQSVGSALPVFNELVGVEFVRDYAFYCRGRFRDNPRVQIFEGCSVDWLATLLPGSAHLATTFWLDAHYTGDPLRPGMMSRFGECPLLNELAVINRVDWTTKPIMLIDDLHMYEPAFWETEAAENYTRADWPKLSDIKQSLPDYEIHTSNGVIYAF
jgi:hypothetical protein